MVSGWYQQPPHDEGDRAVVRLGEPIRSAYVLIERDHLANVTSLEHERWKRAQPDFCRRVSHRVARPLFRPAAGTHGKR